MALLVIQIVGLHAFVSSAEAAHRNPAVIATLPIGSDLGAGMAVDETRNLVYVTDGVGTVSVVNGATNTHLATVPIGTSPEVVSGTIVDLAFNPSTNLLYATFSDASAGALLTVIDGTNSSVLGGHIVLGGTAAGNVTVNPATNRVYVYGFSPSMADPETNPAGTGVFVVDAPTGDLDAHRVLDRIPVRHCAVGPYAPIQVNPRTNRIYLTETGCFGFFEESLLAIDGNTHELAPPIPLDQNEPYDVAVECPTWRPADPTVECPPSQGNRVFVSSASGGGLKPFGISVFDEDTGQAVRLVDGVFGDVGFNPTTSRLYASYFDESGSGFAVIDPERGPGASNHAGLNLNPRDSGDQDVDVTVRGRYAVLVAGGGGGNDTIVPAPGGPFPNDGVYSKGGPGDDRLIAPRDGGGILEGGAGDDVVIGGRSRDLLYAGRGNDRAAGGSGRDQIIGGLGRDLLSGGRGRDHINARDPKREIVKCGPGRDFVRADRVERLRGCELIRPR